MPNETKTTELETGSRAFVLVYHYNYVSIHYAEIIAKARDLIGELVYFMRISPSDSIKQSLPNVIHASSRLVSSSVGAVLKEASNELNEEEITLQKELNELQEELANIQPSIAVADQKVSRMRDITDKLKTIGELKASLDNVYLEEVGDTTEQKNSV